MSGPVRVEVVDRVAVVTLSRPQVLNALNLEALRALAAALGEHGRGSGGIVITGQGRAFSSGDDLKASEGMDRARFVEVIDAFQEITRAILRTEVPVAAALNGIAVGGAAEISFACDLRIGCPATEFLLPENGLGLTISNGSTVTLPALVGRRAIGVVLSGERIGAERAQALGLIDVMADDAGQVVSEAVRRVSALTAEGMATAIHLRMLRPEPDAIERALEAETVAALEAWDAGLPQQGIARFVRSRR
ncbi:MAG TPA: enoyl-CoA hydratase/isomerase family protein [Actinomycetota bacterium]|nr:enoyl-CoA hydratase/isomerase family protein [Actinomycetota bacterium]